MATLSGELVSKAKVRKGSLKHAASKGILGYQSENITQCRNSNTENDNQKQLYLGLLRKSRLWDIMGTVCLTIRFGNQRRSLSLSVFLYPTVPTRPFHRVNRFAFAASQGSFAVGLNPGPPGLGAPEVHASPNFGWATRK